MQKIRIQRLVLLNGFLDRKLFRQLLAPVPEIRAKPCISQNLTDTPCESPHIAGRAERSLDALHDRFGGTAHSSSHDRHTAGSRLQQSARQALPVGRQQEDIKRLQQGRDISTPAEQVDPPLQSLCLNHRLDARP